MATKKQKREAGLAKRAEFLAKEREIGLAAQRRAREEEEQETARIKEQVEAVNRKYRQILAANLIASGSYK